MRDAVAAAESRVNSLNAEMGEARKSVVVAEKARKALVGELQEMEARLNDSAAQVDFF